MSAERYVWETRMKDRYILIELTDFCNYNCIMCSHDNRMGPHCSPQGFMDRSLFQKILDELEPSPLPRGIKLFWLGEPLLNPAFPEMAAATLKWLDNNPGRDYLDLHTNAFFLQDETADLILRTGEKLPRLTLSLDASNPETYRRIRRGGDLERVEANIESFLKKREKLGQIWPAVIFQFIVMDENKDELGDFVKRWSDFLRELINPGRGLGRFLGLDSRPRDVIWIKRVDVEPARRQWAEDVYHEALKKSGVTSGVFDQVEIIASVDNLWQEPEQRARTRQEQELYTTSISPEPTASDATAHESGDIEPGEKVVDDTKPEEKKADDMKSEEKSCDRGPCSALFKTPCIRWDGELTVCCFDPAMQLSLGNLRENTLEELWHGKAMKSFRTAHINGRFGDVITSDGYRKCLFCSGYDTPSIEEEEISVYLDAMQKGYR